jgi:predicted TIM-barrel fold metal-dependent hydrolase
MITMLGALSAAAQTKDVIVETHVYLFSEGLSRFPGAPGWKVRPSSLERYLQFAKQAGIAHAIHVSAEPYQNDLRYLEHTLETGPKSFLKGTLLLDLILDDTPRRMAEYVKRHPRKIVAMRIHCTRDRDVAPTTSGPLRDRDLLHPGVGKSWKAAGELNIAIQAHIQPWFAPQVAKHAAELPATRVIFDHFGHAGVSGAVKTASGEWNLTNGERGYHAPKDFEPVVQLAKLPKIILKVSGLQYSSREAFPHPDVKPLARKAFDAFGRDRMVWGSLGASLEQFKSSSEIFDTNFSFLTAADRAKIRGLTAKRIFGFA